SVISTGLEAEHGISYEAGIKSNWLKQHLYAEVNGFYYRLHNTIVVRRTPTGADYFVNAGSTRQQGIESQATYQFLQRSKCFISNARIFISHTWNNFRYLDFKKDTISYKDKRLPSVAPNIVAFGLDIFTKPGLYANITWFYSDPIPLNDVNSVVAGSYQLTEARIGWRKPIGKKIMMNVFAGADNLFDARYSLGNDINMSNGRFYNAAAGRNYFAGAAFNFSCNK
ncbi:MAG: TonB-dependent receptor, partial [Bacteroidota bacterium]|nr:TonB-dependent receptor [Bacteroidota bacterium]